ncbi:DUF4184 family protein [Pontibacter harenae]|uniref:DUF4184 family protein n=1 Tax=Pontibacter harenae TaxID=2894083 RepID=UPI001E3DD576|nr:DUF4184 family protein [Pontibacter harenae]MCC9165721.1 DUF4184 family protein [Pontibacter harenae]
MPFTFSHPAIVLPGYYFPKRWRSLTGLIIGSVAPDFEMFFRMKAHMSYTHSWHSIFWLNLPVAILLAFLFHLLVRNPLLHHLPLFLKQRLHTFTNFNWPSYFRENYITVILSILVGAASHIFWDSFTHAYGIFIKWFPVLAAEVLIAGKVIPVYTLLQLAFSVLGALLILYAILQLPPDKNVKVSNTNLSYWMLITAITALLTIVRLITGINFSHLPNMIVVPISGGLLSLLLTPLIMKKAKLKSATASHYKE